jgi:hypothetical protein
MQGIAQKWSKDHGRLHCFNDNFRADIILFFGVLHVSHALLQGTTAKQPW